jgi:hypothetical protein
MRVGLGGVGKISVIGEKGNILTISPRWVARVFSWGEDGDFGQDDRMGRIFSELQKGQETWS